MKNHSKEKKRGSLATNYGRLCNGYYFKHVQYYVCIKWCTITDSLGSTDNDDGSGREQR